MRPGIAVVGGTLLPVEAYELSPLPANMGAAMQHQTGTAERGVGCGTTTHIKALPKSSATHLMPGILALAAATAHPWFRLHNNAEPFGSIRGPRHVCDDAVNRCSTAWHKVAHIDGHAQPLAQQLQHRATHLILCVRVGTPASASVRCPHPRCLTIAPTSADAKAVSSTAAVCAHLQRVVRRAAANELHSQLQRVATGQLLGAHSVHDEAKLCVCGGGSGRVCVRTRRGGKGQRVYMSKCLLPAHCCAY